MKRIISLVALGIACTVGTAAAENGKIGFVDVQKILNLSEAGKDAKEQLSGKVKKYQEDINSKQEELKKLNDELQKQKVLLSEAAWGEKEKVYQQKLKDYQRFVKDAEDDLRGKDEEYTKRILEEIEKVVQEYGRKNGYSLVFERNAGMIYADDKSDLSEAVLKVFNENRKKK